MEYTGNPDAIGIFLKGEKETALLGRFDKTKEIVRFRPAVPFEPGQVYEVREAGQTLADFSIPSTLVSTLPEIIGMYPAQDSVPENLLKIYV